MFLIFLKDLINNDLTNFQIAKKWGIPKAYMINLWRISATFEGRIIKPELRKYLRESPVKLIYSKEQEILKKTGTK